MQNEKGQDPQELAPCSGCGLVVEGGDLGCHRLVEELWAREFSDPAYFRAHRLCVDAYCLQHPERYCVSAKSFAAHFVRLGWFVEHGEDDRAKFQDKFKHWIESSTSLLKPQLPSFRGQLTVASVLGDADPDAYAQALAAWARSIWEAYAPLYSLAHTWFEQVLRL